jgi:hypothetical protein
MDVSLPQNPIPASVTPSQQLSVSLSLRDATLSARSDSAGYDEKIASSRYSAGRASENESNLTGSNDLRDKTSCNAYSANESCLPQTSQSNGKSADLTVNQQREGEHSQSQNTPEISSVALDLE